MNFYGIYRGFYDIETGFYDIEVGVYEIDGRVYEMVPSEEQMLLQRHRRPIADAEPVRGSLLRGLDQTRVPLHLAPARETRPCLIGYSDEEALYNTGVHGMMASVGSALV